MIRLRTQANNDRGVVEELKVRVVGSIRWKNKDVLEWFQANQTKTKEALGYWSFWRDDSFKWFHAMITRTSSTTECDAPFRLFYDALCVNWTNSDVSAAAGWKKQFWYLNSHFHLIAVENCCLKCRYLLPISNVSFKSFACVLFSRLLNE